MTATTISTEIDSTRTVGDTVRGSKQRPKVGIGGAIRRLFRQAVKVLTGREAAAPIPKKSGSCRSGETRRVQFIKLARRLTRLQASSITALPWLADTLDWLNLWHPGGSELTDDRSQAAPNDSLSPRL